MRTGSLETKRIADQLHSLYYGPSWLGPSVAAVVGGIDDQQASKHPISSAHSVLELTMHITAWLRIARERLSAVDRRDASDEENWPAATVAWEKAKQDLKQEVDELERAILSFSEDRLNEMAPAGEPQSYYSLLHGVIQHTAYHAGQMVVLGK